MLLCAIMSQFTAPHPALRGPVPLIHLLLQRFIKQSDRVIDATCGNGKDTLLLAELVGNRGHVFAFDIQQQALDRTAERLQAQNLRQRVTLLCDSHEHMGHLIKEPVQAILFNLGWLPGSSRQITTTSHTTLAALTAALPLLAPGGLVLITCYPGHAGGDLEAAEVQSWASQLTARSYFVWRMGQLNVAEDAPFCLIIQDGRPSHAH